MTRRERWGAAGCWAGHSPARPKKREAQAGARGGVGLSLPRGRYRPQEIQLLHRPAWSLYSNTRGRHRHPLCTQRLTPSNGSGAQCSLTRAAHLVNVKKVRHPCRISAKRGAGGGGSGCCSLQRVSPWPSDKRRPRQRTPAARGGGAAVQAGADAGAGAPPTGEWDMGAGNGISCRPKVDSEER
jgi:hypothetical protein